MRITLKATPLQKKILKSESKIIVLSCGRATGKTATVAIVAVLAMLKGERVIICAPVYRTLRDSNFREAVKFIELMGLSVSVNYSSLKINRGKGEIIFLSGDNPERFRSYTSISTVIFDEAALLDEDCYKLAIATMRDLKGFKKRIFTVSTPPQNESHWMVRLARREDVETFYGSAKENPFIEESFLEELEAEYEYLPDDFKKRELYGEFVFPAEAGSLFSEFELSTEDYSEPGAPIVAGLDIAGMGRDMTCLVVSQGKKILSIKLQKTMNETELKSFLQMEHIKQKFSVLRYDSTGMGHLLQFKNMGECKIEPVNFGAGGGERFAKARGAIYFALSCKKKLYCSKEIEAAHGRLLRDELRAVNYKFDDAQKINLVPKDKIAEKLGRSPDRADALALAMTYAAPIKTEPIKIRTVFDRKR